MLCVQGSWKDLSFPIVQAVPEQPINGCLKRLYRFLTYRRKWKVMEDYAVWSGALKTLIIIPEGFIFDGASVPKIFHSILGPTGMLLYGSCPHDFGYIYAGLIILDKIDETLRFQRFSKSAIDSIFLELCIRESSVFITSYLAEHAVCAFGVGNFGKESFDIPNVYEDFPDFFKIWCDNN